MCEQIAVDEVPKISCQDSVEAIKITKFWKDVGTDGVCSSAQDLKPGVCRGSQNYSLTSEFQKGCSSRLGLLKCPRSQAKNKFCSVQCSRFSKSLVYRVDEALPNRMIFINSWTPCSIGMQCSRMSLTAACVK